MNLLPRLFPCALSVCLSLSWGQNCPTSAITEGNNYRLKTAIDKAKAGEEVTLAYLGGSITDGSNAEPKSTNSYAYLSWNNFKNNYGSNAKLIRAGIAGTDSELGLVRYDRDISRNGTANPDIVVIEFAVNDDNSKNSNLPMEYEALVRKALKGGNSPAVVLLFSTASSYDGAESSQRPIGEFYNLPMISMKTAGAKTLSGYFSSDGLHPSNSGHSLMANCLNLLFSTVNGKAKNASDISVSASTKISGADRFDNIRFFDKNSIPSGVSVSAGSFTGTAASQSANFDEGTTSTNTFPNNWYRNGGSEAFILDINSKNLILVYLENSGYGNAGVSVDNGAATSINASQTWTHTYSKLLYNNAASAQHNVKITPSGNFTILGFGYTIDEGAAPSSSSAGASSSSGGGAQSSSSSGTTPLNPIPYTQNPSSLPTYYNLQGQPLGTIKPKEAGVYIEKIGKGNYKTIIVR